MSQNVKLEDIVPGFYWFYPRNKVEPMVVKVYDVFHHFPGVEKRLEVYFTGSETGTRVEDLLGVFLGPLMVPILDPVPEVRDKMITMTRSWVESMFKDPTCAVTLSSELRAEPEALTSDDPKYILPSRREVRIGTNGGGRP